MGSENMERNGWKRPLWQQFNDWVHQQPTPVGVPYTFTSEAPQAREMYPLVVPISQVRKQTQRG